MDAAIAGRQAEADSLLATDLSAWDVIDYEVLAYSIRNVSQDAVSVDVSFRGDPQSGKVLRRDVWLMDGYGNSRPKGEVRRVLRFKVLHSKIVGIS